MYVLYGSNCIMRTTDGVFIPVDESNRDYQEYLAWISAGNTPSHKDAECANTP